MTGHLTIRVTNLIDSCLFVYEFLDLPFAYSAVFHFCLPCFLAGSKIMSS